MINSVIFSFDFETVSQKTYILGGRIINYQFQEGYFIRNEMRESNNQQERFKYKCYWNKNTLYRVKLNFL
jgi:hypothetical protein